MEVRDNISSEARSEIGNLDRAIASLAPDTLKIPDLA
jgi:hypothetical protein